MAHSYYTHSTGYDDIVNLIQIFDIKDHDSNDFANNLEAAHSAIAVLQQEKSNLIEENKKIAAINDDLMSFSLENNALKAQLEKARILQEESQREWEQERAKHDKLLRDSEDTCKNSLAAFEHDKRVAIGELSHRILQNNQEHEMVINEFNRRASSVDQERLQERSSWAKQRESFEDQIRHLRKEHDDLTKTANRLATEARAAKTSNELLKKELEALKLQERKLLGRYEETRRKLTNANNSLRYYRQRRGPLDLNEAAATHGDELSDTTISSSVARSPPSNPASRRSRSRQRRTICFDLNPAIDSLNSSLSDPSDSPQHTPQAVRSKSHASNSKSGAWKEIVQCIDDSIDDAMPPPLHPPPHRPAGLPTAKGRVTPSKRPDTMDVDQDDQRYSEACAVSPAKRMRDDASKSKEDGIASTTAALSKQPIHLRTLFDPSYTDDELSEAPDP